MTRQRFIAAYDIRDSSRLARVRRAVRSHSTGGQKSVHECWLTRKEAELLHQDIGAIIDEQQDSVVLVPVDALAMDSRLGNAPGALNPDFIYVGD